MKRKVLIFTLACNGYDKIFEDCIKSHSQYAAKHSYDYLLINNLPGNNSASEIAWLKVPLLINFLEDGYQWVAYIDADCLINANAPRIESVREKGKCVYVCKGFSGRLNAGVLIFKNERNSIRLLSTILSNCMFQVPVPDRAPYENGHFIHFSKDKKYVCYIDRKWNNNTDSNLNDYIRHYSRGSKVEPFVMNFSRRVKTVIITTYYRLKADKALNTNKLSFKDKMNYMTDYINREYSI